MIIGKLLLVPHAMKLGTCYPDSKVKTEVAEFHLEPEDLLQKATLSESSKSLREILRYLKEREDSEHVAAQWYHICGVLDRIMLICYMIVYLVLILQIQFY